MIRKAMDRAGLHNARIQRYGPPANNELLVALDIQETTEQALDKGKNQIIQALETNTPPRQAGPQQQRRAEHQGRPAQQATRCTWAPTPTRATANWRSRSSTSATRPAAACSVRWTI